MSNIAVLAGDGVGPEVVKEGIRVLTALADKWGQKFEFSEAAVGGAALDLYGVPLPDDTLKLAQSSDAVLLGAVGGPKWDKVEYDKRPEQALLDLRRKLGLYANLRPVCVFAALVDSTPLKAEVVNGVDLVVVRELTGGIYFGNPRGLQDNDGQLIGINTEIYTSAEVERIARKAFEIARTRRQQVTSVDKANVLESSLAWRKTVSKVKEDYPEIELNNMLVDNCAMQLIRNPGQFDVIVTTNMFGDILSDEAAMLAGSLGMLPSASLGGEVGLYEPVHGSAPDIAGEGLANPIGLILSCGMMLRYSFGLADAANEVESAVEKVVAAGHRTQDICPKGMTPINTSRMGELIATEIISTSGG